MLNQEPETETPADRNDPFAAFFEGAERSPVHCLGLAKLEFTEEIVNRMHAMHLKKGELARRLDVQPGFVTRLLSGRNNFELGTMVKVALALDCEFRCHLQPVGTETMWLDFLKEKPVRPAAAGPAGWHADEYKTIPRSHPPLKPDESLAAVA